MAKSNEEVQLGIFFSPKKICALLPPKYTHIKLSFY